MRSVTTTEHMKPPYYHRDWQDPLDYLGKEDQLENKYVLNKYLIQKPIPILGIS